MLVEEFGPIPLHRWLETFSVCQGAEIWSTYGPWIEESKPEFGPRTQCNSNTSKILTGLNLAMLWNVANGILI